MSLSLALSAALSGLQASQSALSLVAANVANAGTPGYVRKTPLQVATAAGSGGLGVRIAGIERELDRYVLRQLQVETAGGAYADLRALFYQRLQAIYGVPGADGALETAYNRFTTALQALSTTPESAITRSNALAAAQELTQLLNRMSADIQALRADAELGLSEAVRQANEAMQQIARLNQQLGAAVAHDPATANLLDQRDYYIGRLAELMDVRTVATDQNQIVVFTNSGIQLVGQQAAQLSFDATGTMTATSRWSADPSVRTVGTLTLTAPSGGSVDLIASKSVRSGEITALLEMRDQVLVEAQSQLDQIAAALASALSDRTTAGTAVTVGAQAGYEVDIGGVLAGNTIRIAYTDTISGIQHRVTIVRVDDPASLPLPATATADPDDIVIGVDFSGGIAAVVAELNAALGPGGLQFSNPGGTVLRVLDDGAGNTCDVDALAAIATVTTLTGGSAELPFFLDGNGLYTGAIVSARSQAVGLASRIAVNPALLADPTRLVVYQTSPLTPSGDATRPDFILDRLTGAVLEFSPLAGIGTTAAPFRGSLPAYLRQMLAQQGQAAEAAERLRQGQDIVVNALRQRFEERSGVSIDTEMAHLLQLQTAYSANARIMSAIRELFDRLLEA